MTDGIATLRAGPTERWRGLLGGTLLAAAAGLVTGSAGLVLLAGVGTALLAYGRVVTPPPATLSVERDCTPADPDRDEPVTVELTVTNVGERTLSDVRVVDGVPDGLTVTDATPAVGTALRPGGSVTVTYEIRGSRPRYRFEPVTVVLRDVAGVVERRVECPVDDEIGWATGEATVPLAPKQSLVPGPLPVEDGGDGVALHAVREYQPRDPLRRIDWRHRAKTGDFATVEYQRERAATVVVVVDTRPAADLAPGPGEPTAIDRSVDAAGTLVDTLLDAGHRVGLAALSPPTLVDPATSERHRRRCHERLAGPAFSADDGGDGTDDAAGPIATDSPGDGEVRAAADGGTAADDTTEAGDGSDDADGAEMVDSTDETDTTAAVDTLCDRLPATATVVLCSPLCDRASTTAARRLAARSAGLTVVSPDPTTTGTAGRGLARLERRTRLRRLRGEGVAVLDWQPGESLARSLAAAGWSA